MSVEADESILSKNGVEDSDIVDESFQEAAVLIAVRFNPNFWPGPGFARSPAPVKSRQKDHLYSKLLRNCDTFIPLPCRDFTGAGDWTAVDSLAIR